MPKHGKKYRHAVSMLPRGVKLDDPAKALELVKESAFAKFDETVEVSVRLGVDPRHADQVVRGTVVLPHGTGKTVRVLVLAEGDQARAGEEAGADFVGMEHIARIKEGWTDFDVVVATPLRLIDLLKENEIDLSAVQIVVLDEADRMADDGFTPQVEWILRKCTAPRQTMLFSATLDGDVDALVARYQRDPARHDADLARALQMLSERTLSTIDGAIGHYFEKRGENVICPKAPSRCWLPVLRSSR